jgi:hypothetical protein
MTMTNHVATDSTGDEVRQAAAAALADVDALEATGEDRKILLKALLHARLMGSTPAQVAAAPVGQVSSSAGPATVAPPVAEGDVLGMIGAAMKVDRDTLELVYAVENGEPQVVVSAKKLPANKSLAAKHLAQLVAAARQAAGLEEWTQVGTIRTVVQEYGRLDSGNFASSIKEMDKVCLIRGSGLKREVKVTKPGFEMTGDLIREIAGAVS